MSNVEKSLICLEDMALGGGTVVQDRAGQTYVLHRIDLVPTFDSVDDLNSVENYTRAKVGLVNYKFENNQWVIDPIPLAALGAGLGSAASRNAAGPGDLLPKGYAGVGGPGIDSLVGAGVGLKSSYVESIAEGGPANEPTVILTLPGAAADAARLAITLTSVALYVQKVGLAWIKVVLPNTAVEFTTVKANSVRATTIGTPKD